MGPSLGLPLRETGFLCWYRGSDVNPDWNAAVLPEAMRALAVQAGSGASTAPNCGSEKNPSGKVGTGEENEGINSKDIESDLSGAEGKPVPEFTYFTVHIWVPPTFALA